MTIPSNLPAAALLTAALSIAACEAAPEADAPQPHSSALETGDTCLMQPSLFCPAGFAPNLFEESVFTCQRQRTLAYSCATGFYPFVTSGQDQCRQPCQGCPAKQPRCPVGSQLRAQAGTDVCVSTEFAYPQNCSGDPDKAKLGVTCPFAFGQLVGGAMFRCVHRVPPHCPPGMSLHMTDGQDFCEFDAPSSSKRLPFCDPPPHPATEYRYFFDVTHGNRDRCIAHGWPLPVVVTAP